MTRFDGHVAVVAGATRGAGRGIARSLAEAGALVYCTGGSAAGHKGMDRPETIEETVALIEQASGRAITVRGDHTREDEVASLAARAPNWRDAIAKDPFFLKSAARPGSRFTVEARGV